MMPPRVSVCVPTYNCAHYLGQALDSVLSQGFGDFELVVCDDVSTDDTGAMVAGYRDPRVRYRRFETRGGQAGNFNRCLDAASGEYVTLLHADDFFLPGFLEDRVRRLDASPSTGWVFGSVRTVDAEARELPFSRPFEADRAFAPGELLEPLLHGCIVCPPSMMVRKRCIDEVGLFRTDLTWGHDWEWALRLAELAGVEYASEPLAAYRVHDGSGTAEMLSAAKNGHQERRILHDTLRRLEERRPELRRLRRSIFHALALRHMHFAADGLMRDQPQVARSNLWYAALADPRMLTRPSLWAVLLAASVGKGTYTRFRRLRERASRAD